MDLRSRGAILLISCYELGHQPLSLALPAGFLEEAGFQPDVLDIAVQDFDEEKAAKAAFVGIAVPMHTALRLGVRVAERIKQINPDCHICFYGLYASLNSEYLLGHDADTCLGGEYEKPLVELVLSIEAKSTESIAGVSRQGSFALPVLEKIPFAPPSRSSLPSLCSYAHLDEGGEERTAGYTEASRGCLHLCTHCPIPPVYNGRFFILPQEVVLEDIRQQVAAGATHISFGDPDFLNGPNHSLRVVRAMHEEFPSLTFDFTAKVEHLLTRGEGLPEFAESGCLFVITAVESLSDRVLTILDKRHTREDVVNALQLVRDVGIAPRPTWVTFTPWTTRDDLIEVLDFVEENGYIDNIDPVQYSVRLLIPPGSWLADHEETIPFRGELDEAAFTYRWNHPDPEMDRLQKEIGKLVAEDADRGADPAKTFYRIKELAHGRDPTSVTCSLAIDREMAPRLTEAWFC
jgi:radical SAM superfamily enzyme YgiQ (UPF0313 family)